jgi:hypothetical protein
MLIAKERRTETTLAGIPMIVENFLTVGGNEVGRNSVYELEEPVTHGDICRKPRIILFFPEPLIFPLFSLFIGVDIP